MLFQFVLGLAHAAVVGVLLVAAAGKLAVCRPGARAMCLKGSLDAALALLACAVFVPGASLIGAALAMAVAAGGWLRERITRNSVCNCFGVLTSVLHPWRNVSRVTLFVGGGLVLALAPFTHWDHSSWIGAAAGMAALLASSSLVFARAPALRPAPRIALSPVDTLAPGTISPGTPLGIDAHGRSLAPDDLGKPGAPFALLLTSPACNTCRQIKAQLAPLLPRLPLPVFLVTEAERTDGERTDLFDPEAQLRTRLGVKTVPSLVVINAERTNLACSVAMGDANILALLLRLALETTPGTSSSEQELRVQGA